MVWVEPKTIWPPDDGQFGGERSCGQCLRHCEIDDEDHVACTAAFEDEPIWAVRRKKGRQLRKTILEWTGQYFGLDPEEMRRDDGIECDAFIRGKDLDRAE